MKEDCLDIGIIQAFLDGELAHDQTARVSGHVAICDSCAVTLADAEDESALVFSTLEREFDTLVPTQRLWNKINLSIETEREGRPFWQKAYAYLAIAFANPSLAAASSLLIVFGVFAAIWMNTTSNPITDVAGGARPQSVVSTVQTSAVPDQIVTMPSTETEPTPNMRVKHAAFRPEPRTTASSVTNASYAGYLPGEQSYIKTIANLSKTADEQMNTGIMRASERIAYEREMAVVEDSIAKMKKEVRRNPKNESAKQVLYASYQNKIDLLNSVSQKEELLVSLK